MLPYEWLQHCHYLSGDSLQEAMLTFVYMKYDLHDHIMERTCLKISHLHLRRMTFLDKPTQRGGAYSTTEVFDSMWR